MKAYVMIVYTMNNILLKWLIPYASPTAMIIGPKGPIPGSFNTWAKQFFMGQNWSMIKVQVNSGLRKCGLRWSSTQRSIFQVRNHSNQAFYASQNVSKVTYISTKNLPLFVILINNPFPHRRKQSSNIRKTSDGL